MSPAKTSGQRSQHWILPGPFRRDGGMAWIADLPAELMAEADNNEAPYRSPLLMFEGDTELGPGHALHASIQDRGNGRYSFWLNVVYFSSSDGSDPNNNGRVYSVERMSPRPDPAAVIRSITAANAPRWTKPQRPVRCAVLGLGNRGKALTRILAGLSGVEISWLVDVSAERALAVQASIDRPATRTSSNLDDALADPAVDAVFITVPDSLHRAIAEKAGVRCAKKHFNRPLRPADRGKGLFRSRPDISLRTYLCGRFSDGLELT